jgi:hypothetical protein
VGEESNKRRVTRVEEVHVSPGRLAEAAAHAAGWGLSGLLHRIEHAWNNMFTFTVEVYEDEDDNKPRR